MKKHNVHLIADAEEDLYKIYNYVSTYDSISKAENLLDKLEETCNKLSTLPNRGHIPLELARIGISAYKEIHYKPHRIIYHVVDTNIHIHCILDGRRDLPQLLQERLIR